MEELIPRTTLDQAGIICKGKLTFSKCNITYHRNGTKTDGYKIMIYTIWQLKLILTFFFRKESFLLLNYSSQSSIFKWQILTLCWYCKNMSKSVTNEFHIHELILSHLLAVFNNICANKRKVNKKVDATKSWQLSSKCIEVSIFNSWKAV